VLDKIVEKLTEAVARRNFLGKFAAAAAAVILGPAGVARAGGPGGSCCSLCKASSQSCSNCVCSWSWTCPGGNLPGSSPNVNWCYKCLECYGAGSNCGCCDCTHAICSQSILFSC
jgi:hypothetical protein